MLPTVSSASPLNLNERLPFDDESFNAAICHNVIEQLADTQAFIAEAAPRVLLLSR